jgi:hypothetical protein
VRTIVVAALVGAIALGSDAAVGATWPKRVSAAAAYAKTRAGVESFAVVDKRGKLHGYRVDLVARSASVFKAMLLVTYLRQASVRDRPLYASDRRLLEPMIRWSDNATATTIRNRVGAAAIYRLARLAGMTRFRLRYPWGFTEITARDQARFFFRIDRYVPRRHRVYARRLLTTIVSSQRWGIAAVRPRGWRIFFKGGWGSGSGAVTHQVALLERGDERVSVAILTRLNPSHRYGAWTVRGIAGRLLRDLRTRAAQ